MKRLSALFLLTASALISAAANAFAAEDEFFLDTPGPSFIYDGKLFAPSGFTQNVAAEEKTEQFDAKTTHFVAKDGKLQMTVVCRRYKNYPVLEYSVRLTNLSKTEPTEIVENFQSLDFDFPVNQLNEKITLNNLIGSVCAPIDFTPQTFRLKAGEQHAFTTPSGRSSGNQMPFIEMNFDESVKPDSGILFAVGWTGSWAAYFRNSGQYVNVCVGMDRSRFKLLPGETILQPSMTLFFRNGAGRREFKTTVHRFMVEFKSPRDADGNVIPPIMAVTAGGGNKTPQMMLDVLNYVLDNQMPFDTYWVDAGWYGAPHEDEHFSNCGSAWARYVGDWKINTTTHPTGTLLPIADAVHKAGMKFLLWFEPERMEDGAPILEKHPEFRHKNLLDYGNPEALAWIQKTVYGIIDLHDINVYRQDFNMDPRRIWIEMDAADPDRVGIGEARHITGVYQFLDQMRERFPGILQENCSSGGRRLDIEMTSRAHAYCRSDYFIGPKPGDTAFVLGQNATLNTTPYLPFQGGESNCVPIGDDYGMMSVVSSGTVFTPTDLDGAIVKRPFTAEETAWLKKVYDIAARMNRLYLGDFYPLTDETTADNDVWCAWQVDKPDENAGFALAFRRADAPTESQTFKLGNIDANARYEVEFFDGSKKIIDGRELADWEVKLPPRSFLLVFYKKLTE